MIAQDKKNLWMYPLGTVGRDMVYTLFTNYILTFILFTRTLDPAHLAAITAIMIAARVFDALNDPIMGNIIERTRTKWGKFKPWLLIGILSTSLVVYAAFNNDLQGWPFVIFFGGIYFLYSITYTMNDIAYWGMVPALSSDGHSRNQFTSRATLFAGIGGTLAAILIPMLTTGSLTIGGNTATAYGVVALAICIISPLFVSFTLLGVKENRSDMAKPAIKVSLKMIIRTIVSNDQLLWISLIFLIQQIGNGIVLGGVGSTYIYFEFGYSRNVSHGLFDDLLSSYLQKSTPKEADDHHADSVGGGILLHARRWSSDESRHDKVHDHHSRIHAGEFRTVLLLSHHDDIDHQHG